MTRTSDPYCNAVMREWDQAKQQGDREKQLLFLALCEQHRAPSIDWRRVAEDAGIKVPNPISESRAVALNESLTSLVYEVGLIIEHSGSTDLILAYNRAKTLLTEEPK